jgi:uncharacterized protein YbbC (DUF1343 family)
VLARLGETGLPGVSFTAVRFVPRAPGDGKYADTLLAGIRLAVTDRNTYDPTRTAVTLLSIIAQVQPEHFRFSVAQFDRLAGGPALRQALLAARSPGDIAADWEEPRREFLTRSRPFRLY